MIAGHTDAGEAGVVVRAEGSWTIEPPFETRVSLAVFRLPSDLRQMGRRVPSNARRVTE